VDELQSSYWQWYRCHGFQDCFFLHSYMQCLSSSVVQTVCARSSSCQNRPSCPPDSAVLARSAFGIFWMPLLPHSRDLSTVSGHWPHYQPSSAIAASARAMVSSSLSPNNSRKRAGRPSGGPFSMISRMLAFKPMDRSWLRLGTRDRATYTTNHLMSLLMRLGNRQWKMRPGSAVAPCNVYSDDASKDVSGTWRRITLSGY